MATNDPAWVRKIKDLTECSICTEEFVDPRALPCLHTFCFKCLRALIRQTDTDEAYLCPLCRCEFHIPDRGIVDFPKNFYVDSLIEVEKEGDSQLKLPYSSASCDICTGLTSKTPARRCATWYCSDCDQNLCDNCFQCHKRITTTNMHHLVPSSIASRGSSAAVKTVERKFCERHPERVTELWCRDCREPSCTMCLLSDHNGHRFGAFRDCVTRSLQPAAAQLGARSRVVPAATPAHQSWSDLVLAAHRSTAGQNAVTATVSASSSRAVATATTQAAVRPQSAQAAVRQPAAQAAVIASGAQAAVRPAATQAAVRPAATQTAVRPAAAQAAVRPAAAQTAARPAAAQTAAAQDPELPELMRLITLRLAGVFQGHLAATATSVATSSVATSSIAATSTVISATRTTPELVTTPIAATSTSNSSTRATAASGGIPVAATSAVNSSTRTSAVSAASPITSTVRSSTVSSAASVSTPTGASIGGASASSSASELAPPFTFTGHCYRCGWQGHRAFECQEEADEASASPSDGVVSAEGRSSSREDSSDDEVTSPRLAIVARALATFARSQPDLLLSRQQVLGDSDDSSSEASFLALPPTPPPPAVMHCNGCGREGHTSRFCRNKQQCHNCGCYGHKKETCDRETRVTKCYECNEMGHVAQDCPTTAYRRVSTS